MLSAVHGVCIRKSGLSKVGQFRESLRTGEDIEFMARVFRELSYAVVPEFLVNFQEHTGERLSKRKMDLSAQMMIYQEHIGTIQRNRTVAASVHARFSSSHYRMGNLPEARKEFLRFVWSNPLQSDGWKIFLRGELRAWNQRGTKSS